MRRELPPRANLDHLKKQAKDLLDAHRRAEPEALARIRESLPAAAGMSDEAVAKAPFALHDAQSVVAREYGSATWNALREAVEAQQVVPTTDFLRAIMPMPFPPEVGERMREAGAQRWLAGAAAKEPLAPTLPLLTVRDAILVPRAIGPFQIARASSRAALESAMTRTPPTLAVFAQRSPRDEEPDAAALHPVGCEAYVHAMLPAEEGRAWVVLEGVRWIALEGVDEGSARVKPATSEPGDPADVAPLADRLRAHMRDLVAAFPDGQRMVALIDAAEPERLADLAIANLPVPVAEKARYAGEPRLVERLRIAATLARCP